MSDLIVVAFDNPDEAGKLLETLHTVERSDNLSLDDAAVVERDEEGKVHVKNETESGVKVGAVGGGLLGLLIASVFFPIAGVVIGAVAGALIGKSLDTGIDKKFVKEVSDKLQPGTSALFVLVREGDPTIAMAALKPYKGTVLQTSLSPEAEEELRHALSKRM
jgi:uncharacterized membrane protein